MPGGYRTLGDRYSRWDLHRPHTIYLGGRTARSLVGKIDIRPTRSKRATRIFSGMDACADVPY